MTETSRKRAAKARSNELIVADDDSTSTPITATTIQTNGILSITIAMGWQLAIVVLVPILGGHELDRHFHTAPMLTIIGLIVAMGGMVLIVKRSLTRLNEFMSTAFAPKPGGQH
jgi:F0F1-type ATP synthase assembly protein I